MHVISPVLLAGGSGTRLWPLSRKTYPKQFAKLLGDKTLFQSSAERLKSSDVIEFAPPITLTNNDFRFIISEQLQEIGINPGPIIIEPEAKNTASAILAASIFAFRKDQHAVMLVAPSDHSIPNTTAFHKAISSGIPEVFKGNMVTFGVKPSRPETGYGYLELAHETLDQNASSNVVRFVEKPDLELAKKMQLAGNFVWNAGIFLFRAEDMIAAFRKYEPILFELVIESVKNSSVDLGFLRLAEEPWCKLPNISIDYAIMEKAHNLVVVPYNSKWSDLGGWDSVWLENNPDNSGNVLSENAHEIECSNCLLRSESSKQQIVGLGLDNIVAIAMPDAVLVANKDRSQDVKHVVTMLKSNNLMQSEVYPKDHRPWGWFECLVLGDRFQVKRIYVKPGAALSLQSHNHRSEHWIVVEGTAKVTIEGTTKLLNEGESIYVPRQAKHRMENPYTVPMILVEVQIGTYLGEDDIIRYEDVYDRN